MHQFSTAAAKPSHLAALRSVGLLSTSFHRYDGVCGSLGLPVCGSRLVRSAVSPLRNENLCTIPPSTALTGCLACQYTRTFSQPHRMIL